MTRVAVHSPAPVGGAMSSPAIRAYQLARELAREFDVTLIAPHVGPGLDILTVEAAQAALGEVLSAYDVVVPQRLPLRTMRRLARDRTHVVYDLYTPSLAEGLAAQAAGVGAGNPLHRAETVLQHYSLAVGDAFVCAAERQRDYWIGVLGALGRLEAAVAHDRTLRTLIDVVPFGVPDVPPESREPALRGVHPKIRTEDRILLWAGGVVPWSDPLTPIAAVARLAQSRPDVKLVFLGVAPPAADAAIAHARSLDVLDEHVFFVPWVPYEQRAGFLLEANVGVAAYFDSLEHRLALRARVFDYLWAGLPVITTAHDAVGDFVAARGLGRAVEFRDVDGWAAAIADLLGPDVNEAARAAIRQVRPELMWSRAVEPLRRLVSAPEPAAPRVAARRLELQELVLRGRLSAARRRRR